MKTTSNEVMVTTYKKRICPVCGKTLSVYNPNNQCWSHFRPKNAKGPSLFLEGVRSDRFFVKTMADFNGTSEDINEL